MKKLIFSILTTLFLVTNILAQAPQTFKYQTLIRNNTGDLIANQLVSFRIGIIQDSINGASVYSEIHIITTNQFGIGLFDIGGGTVESGIFEMINWGNASHFLKLEFDETNTNNYQLMGISQLLSVPYALHAKSADDIDDADADPTNENQVFSVSGDTLFISNGNYVILPGVSPILNCSDPIADVDGNTYNIKLIGSQCWMIENLMTSKLMDSTDIPHVTDNSAWENLVTPAYCWYDNDSATNGSTYGMLYNWHTVNTGILCPTGWHVPTDDEWKTLEMFLGMSEVGLTGLRGTFEGAKLKEAGYDHWNSPNTAATNSSGFTGLPGGSRGNSGGYYSLGEIGAWWTSSESTTSGIWFRYLHYQSSQTGRDDYFPEESGLSVRCVKN